MGSFLLAHWKPIVFVATLLVSVGVSKETIAQNTRDIAEIKATNAKVDELLTEMINRGGKDEQLLYDIQDSVNDVKKDVGNLREDVFQLLKEQRR